MKRKTITLFLTTIAFVVLTPSAFAMPQYSIDYTYYDESGNVVGYSWGLCAGSPAGSVGEITDIATVFQDPCPGATEYQPIACVDYGTVCTQCGYCVTEEYYFSVMYMHSFSDPCLN